MSVVTHPRLETPGYLEVDVTYLYDRAKSK